VILEVAGSLVRVTGCWLVSCTTSRWIQTDSETSY